MKTETFVKRSRIAAPATAVFDWHEQPESFRKLIPPWASVEVLRRDESIRDGALTELQMKIGPYRGTWLLEHRDYQQGKQFSDVQVRGPFSFWKHTHRVEPAGDDECYLEDHIEYKLPAGPLGKLIGNYFIRDKLQQLFDFRHQVIHEEFSRQSAAPREPSP